MESATIRVYVVQLTNILLTKSVSVSIQEKMIPPHISDLKYRTFYEMTPDLVCTLDENGIILDANKRMLEHFGYSKSEVVGKLCFDFVMPEYKKMVLDGFNEMREKGIGPLIEIQLVKKNNTTFFGLCNGATIWDDIETSNIYLITIQDVSLIHDYVEKTKHAEKELEKKYNELKKAYDAIMMVENKYQNLYERSPDLLRTIDLNGVIINCNKSYAQNLGYEKNEIIGSSILKHTADRSYGDLKKGITEWRMSGMISNIEIWLKRKDGSSFPTLFSGNNLYDENGQLIGRTVAFRDISDIYAARTRIEQDQKKINEQYDDLKKINFLLAEAETRFRSLYDTSPDLMRTINSDGNITDCNDAYAINLGYEKQEVIGMSIFDHTAEKNMDNMRQIFGAWKSGQGIINKEIWMKRKDGTIFPTLLSATTFYEGDNQMRSNTIIKDITELYNARKKIEENEAHIRAQYEQLRRIDKSKEEFLTMITHELKTPLVPIQGYVDILLTESFGKITEAQRQRLEIIKLNAHTLSKLMTDLLDVQKIEIGQLRISKERHNLADVMHGIIENMRLTMEKYGIDMLTQLQPDLFCFCDSLRLEQVINNLLSNAIDFCPKENGVIIIKLYADGKNAKIIVKDNGIGISKNKLDQIFVKFYQIDTSVTREHGGSGLGLVVCKGIIEAHGGKIWAESEGQGKGSEIHMLLPLD
ncbi:MAG: PAS domain-containing sensor histidine kinase [Thaumarchaeota archaeon]|nr:PAS domain-containing sensor histidine kinase [Nitrososphaerota archaeon]MDE1830739.1 PAS domain-containing sensor histidine kinase [Nitrososphaerota archaeon]MDE1841175.1 PAS domain-containing sensor histidine kinase [Nitrososphaerota archaeon]MDE1877035.1 PAS domain-containing sensor histidine kinase [Nitrososphaerota archaeon]